MDLDISTLTLADIGDSSWETCLTEADERTCSSYIPVLNKWRTIAENTGDRKRAAIFQLFTSLASLSLRSENPQEPFCRFASGPGWRSLTLEDFRSQQLDFIDQIYLSVVDSEMRARLADVLWVLKRNYKAAQVAIVSYLDSANMNQNNQKWLTSYQRIERATYISLSLKSEFKAKATNFIEERLKRLEDNDISSAETSKLMSLLLTIRHGEPSKYAALAELHAQRSIIEKNWLAARRYFDLAAQWLHRCEPRDESNVRNMRLRSAETHVHEAEEATGRSYAVASHHLSRAIEALRRVGADRERVNELYLQMTDYQKRSMTELQEVSTSFDATEIATRARACVKGKSLTEAILSLCVVARPPTVKDLRKQVEENANNFLYMSLFPTAIVNHEGKVIAAHGPIKSTNASGDDSAVTCRMYGDAKFYRNTTILSAIEPARSEMWDSHHISVSDMLSLVTDNPFVPTGREHIFARGLHAGFSGDYALSLHLLMPQVENSIRRLMAARGVIVSTLKEGIQQEKDLNVLLYDPEAEKLFCEDLLFELRGLLVSRFGTNLRNLMAHGLMSSQDCYSPQSAYFWWMTLRLVCHPYLLPTNESSANKPAKSDDYEVRPTEEDCD